MIGPWWWGGGADVRATPCHMDMGYTITDGVVTATMTEADMILYAPPAGSISILRKKMMGLFRDAVIETMMDTDRWTTPDRLITNRREK